MRPTDFPSAPRDGVDEQVLGKILALRPRLLRILAARGIPPEIAEELFQDAFVIYWKSGVQPQRLRRWFTGVLRHLALEWVRRRQRRARIFTINAADRPDLVTRAPRIDIEGFLAELDPANRNILTALYIEGRETAELAEQLKTTPANIWKRVSRARLALKKKSTPAMSGNPPPNRLIE